VERARRPLPTFRESLAFVWRSLRSMRTALVLLLLVGAASVAGSLVPQTGVSEDRIAALVRDHPLRAAIFRRLGLFDVYGSWWFTTLYALLLVSLATCLLPRTRALARNLRARPQFAQDLVGLRHHAERTLPGEPAEALSRARRVLRRRRFRVAAGRNGGGPMLAAEKGMAREIGSLAFHWAFFLILVGAVYGKATGFTGRAVIIEGSTWTETHAAYDGNIREGSLFREDHSGVGVHVRDFEATYRDDGTPKDFVTHADLLDADGNLVRSQDIRVNHPAELDHVKLYQFGYGWAPVIEVRADGRTVASSPVVFVRDQVEGVDQNALPWRGVLRLPSLRPQVGLEFLLWPDRRALERFLLTGVSSPMLRPFEPVLLVTAYRGDLRLTASQNPTRLDTSGMERFLANAPVAEGRALDVVHGLTLSFPELREYTVLQVTRDRGVPIMLVAAVMILVGLLPALYGSRRKVWVRAEPAGEGTRLEVGGFALQRKAQFEEEFARLVDDLGAAPGGR